LIHVKEMDPVLEIKWHRIILSVVIWKKKLN